VAQHYRPNLCHTGIGSECIEGSAVFRRECAGENVGEIFQVERVCHRGTFFSARTNAWPSARSFASTFAFARALRAFLLLRLSKSFHHAAIASSPTASTRSSPKSASG